MAKAGVFTPAFVFVRRSQLSLAQCDVRVRGWIVTPFVEQVREADKFKEPTSISEMKDISMTQTF